MIACLQGGMGNQMFQYAMARAASIRLGAPLYFNTSRFKRCSIGRKYSLGLWKGIDKEIIFDETNIITENGLPYNKALVASIQRDSTLVGYWQTEKYFSEIADLLRNEFVPKQSMTSHGVDTLAQIMAAGNRSVFLTVRRTDYIDSSFHGLMAMNYYLDALHMIAKEIDPIIFIFSDDPDWCKANFKIPYSSVVAGNFNQTARDHLGREDEELTLMRHCKHAVLANSSYSWWGAWLNPNPGMIIAPKNWFLSTKEDSRDIIPERWIQL